MPLEQMTSESSSATQLRIPDVLENIQLRRPNVEDGRKIWKLVRDTGVLDLNSAYSYLLLCKYFSETCVVATSGNQMAGFVSSFRPPSSPDTIFVWQIAVHDSHRGKGLGIALLKELLAREACKDVRFLETTISPSNTPSQSLFRGLARDLGTGCVVSECFQEDLFPGGTHEKEKLFRIGPIPKRERGGGYKA
jgi:L-2,4-diaminobutyric acid acetyltransferase